MKKLINKILAGFKGALREVRQGRAERKNEPQTPLRYTQDPGPKTDYLTDPTCAPIIGNIWHRD